MTVFQKANQLDAIKAFVEDCKKENKVAYTHLSGTPTREKYGIEYGSPADFVIGYLEQLAKNQPF